MEEIQRTALDKKKEQEEEEEEAQAQVAIWKYVLGFVEVGVVKCAIELGIADVIESHGSPMTLSELSSTLGCDSSLLSRIMRFLTHQKIFKCVSTSHDHTSYAQTPLSRCLMRNGRHSMAARILLETSPESLAHWHGLSARVLAKGEKSRNYDAENCDYNKLFNEAMACDAKHIVPAIMRGCSEVFDGVSSLVDVGGGNGATLCLITEACPWIRGINFDLPHVIAVAPKFDRVEHVAGDMFHSVPKADAAFLKWILHGKGDEECIQILKKCKEAIPKEKGKVIVVDQVIEEGSKHGGFNDVALMLDMVMIVHTKAGRERTLKEWEYVIKMAGFSSYTVKSIHAVQSVIMAFS